MRTGSPRIPGIPDGAGADLSAPSESRPYSRSKRHFAAAAAGDPWHRVSSPLLASSFVMLFTWILGTRVVFAILLELRANWIFRITPVRPRHRVFCGEPSSCIFASAGARLVYVRRSVPVSLAGASGTRASSVLVLLGVTVVEWWLYSFCKVPLTCSYLPGKIEPRHYFLAVPAAWSQCDSLERRLGAPRSCGPAQISMDRGPLGILATLAWLRRAREHSVSADLRFEEDMPPVITSPGLS